MNTRTRIQGEPVSTKKNDPTTAERYTAHIAALERECTGWIEAAERFQRERDALRTHLDVTQEMLDEIAAALPAPEASESGLAQRVKGIVSQRDEFRQWAHDAHKLLTDAHIPYGELPKRVAALVSRCVALADAPNPATLPAPSEQVVLGHLLDVLDACDVDEPGRHALAAVRAVVGVTHA